MRFALQLGYDGDFGNFAARIADFEGEGVTMVSVAEAYSFDAVSQLGYPEKAHEIWGGALAAGLAKRAPELGDLDIAVGVPTAFTDDPRAADGFLGQVRAQLALYIGGMGAHGKNFYNDLACRYGYEGAAGTIQALYLQGKKAEAAAAVPVELAAAVSLIGSRAAIRDRLNSLAAAGVSTVKAHLLARDHDAQLSTVKQLADLIV